MSLELNALLDEVEHQRNVVSTNAISQIRSANGQTIHGLADLDDIDDFYRANDDNDDDLLIVTADDLADTKPLATPQEPMRRFAARREAIALRQQQRKEAHQELLRYPGWNYFLNLNSESTLLLIFIVLTSFRLLGPLINDIIDLTSSFLASSGVDVGGIHDPYSGEVPPSPSTTTTTTTITALTTTLLSTRSMTPLITTLLTIIVFTQLPKLGRYTRINTSLNITTSMPYPPPGLYLTHTLLILTLALVCDFFSVLFFEYRILYHLYLRLPAEEYRQGGFTDFAPLLFQGFLIMYYFIMVLIQICLGLLMLTECYCLYQSQRWWNNYTSSFQTKKRCFIIGSYNQVNALPLPLSAIPSSILLYIRLYFNFYHVFAVYYFKTMILRQSSTPIPTIFPYPTGDRAKFKRLIYKKFPFLQAQTLTTTTTIPTNNNNNNPRSTKTHPHNSSSCSHSHNINTPGMNHNTHDGADNDDDNDDDNRVKNCPFSADKEESEDEKTSLLGGNLSNNPENDPTLVIPCCILPPYIFPIQQVLLRSIWEGFVVHLVEFIKEYRESLSSMHRNATLGRPSEYNEANN